MNEEVDMGGLERILMEEPQGVCEYWYDKLQPEEGKPDQQQALRDGIGLFAILYMAMTIQSTDVYGVWPSFYGTIQSTFQVLMVWYGHFTAIDSYTAYQKNPLWMYICVRLLLTVNMGHIL